MTNSKDISKFSTLVAINIALRRVSDHADFQRLRQIPGIGPIHALTILAEAGDLRRFDHYRQFLKFCGFNLATHQSGQFRALNRTGYRGGCKA